MAILLLLNAPLGAQQPGDTVEVAPGPGYAPQGWLHEEFFGSGYRELWQTPIRVPVLDLDRYAGGLSLEKRGGGLQSMVLHFEGADRRDYVFRSVDKSPDLAEQPAFRDTWVGDIIEDLVGNLHPGGAVVAAPLLDAAGVLHAEPKLVVMPDDPRLGEHREQFAGMLGMIEERPNEVGDGEPGFAGSPRVVATETLLERLERGPEHRVDARAYLRARLMDLYIGDWDRHHDQWRWARFDDPAGGYRWAPIPRDRDYAFADYDGWFMDVGRSFYPKAVRFTPEIRYVHGLTIASRDQDRELLAELPREAYDSAAVWLQSQLTDEAIDAAVRALPPAWYERSGEELSRLLKARRATLPEAAREWYDQLAPLVTVYATDEADVAELDRLRGGALDVRLYRASEAGSARGEPYFERRIRGDETEQVRLFLRGGDDRVVVRGTAERSPMLHVVGGGGDDVLVDSSRVAGRRGRRTAFYDARGENRFEVGPGTRVERRAYEQREERLIGLEAVRTPEHGSRIGVEPWIDYRGPVGLVLGGGPVYTRYGFRDRPYDHRLAARAAYALGDGGFAVELSGDLPREYGPGVRVRALGSQLEAFRFYGFGNAPVADADGDHFVVMRDELVLEAELYDETAGGLSWFAGPRLEYGDGEGEPGSPFARLDPYGGHAFGQIGGQAGVRLDRRDHPLLPRSGFHASAGLAAYPRAWDVEQSFARAELEGHAYLPLALPALDRSVLAARLGGVHLWGGFPVHEAAYLGGSRTLRGYPYQRFAGESMVYGGMELRAPLFPADLRVVRGELGGLLLADAGRVFDRRDQAEQWHGAAGVGAWFRAEVRDRPFAAHAVYARGSEDRFYFGLGLPF